MTDPAKPYALNPDGSPRTPAVTPDGMPYFPSAELTAAVDVARLLGKPLLVSGEPGCGKTQLAYSIAADLGLGPVLRFNTKSTSGARDLFYRYDAIGHFRASQLKPEDGGSADALPHIEVQALGEAILRAVSVPAKYSALVGSNGGDPSKPCVVLIDEVDKAPRDFPNDLLNQMEDFEFDIPELAKDARFRIPKEDTAKLRPIVIITSNSEKNLPEPFLRRCVYHDIAFPGAEMLRTIVLHQVKGADPQTPWVKELIEFFLHVRAQFESRSGHKPATAELIDLARVLQAKGVNGKLKSPASEVTLANWLGVVLKDRDSRQSGAQMVRDWIA